MKDIAKIVIKGSSGYVTVEYAYNDKLTITPGSIAYEYKPYLETEENPVRKWRYTSSSPEFREQFDVIADEIEDTLNDLPNDMIMDVGTITFEITYSDGTKHKEESPLMSNWFHNLFMDIKMMVPFTEMIPPTLWTEEDDEEEPETEE